MRKSGYRTVFHIYLIFFLAMLGAVLAALGLLFLLITVRRPDGSLVRSNWCRFSYRIQIGELGTLRKP